MMLLIHTDGAIRGGNPGGHGVGGYVIKIIDKDMVRIEKGTIDLGKPPDMTNNISEFAAVYAAMVHVIKLGLTQIPIVVKSDSMLVVKQMTNKWNCTVPHLIALRDEIKRITKDFKHLEYQWVPREENTEADEVSKSLY